MKFPFKIPFFNPERKPVFVDGKTLWPGNCDCGEKKVEHHKWCAPCREKKAQARKEKKREQRRESRQANAAHERWLREQEEKDPTFDRSDYNGLPDGANYWNDVKRHFGRYWKRR